MPDSGRNILNGRFVSKRETITANDFNVDLNIKKNLALEQPVTDMNIVLTRDQINSIIREVMGPRGENFNPVAINDDYCCVDASIGSSVAGPVSSVGSSVSIPSPEGTLINGQRLNDIKTHLQHELDGRVSNIEVSLPKDMKIR